MPILLICIFHSIQGDCCCFLTLTLVNNLESVVTQMCWRPRRRYKLLCGHRSMIPVVCIRTNSLHSYVVVVVVVFWHWLIKILESVITQRCWSHTKDNPKNKKNRNSYRKYYAFPPKNARYGKRKKAHKWKGPMCKLKSHGRGYPLNYSIKFPCLHN